MVVSLLKLGSMVLNVSERKLEAEFLTPDLDALGNPRVQDRFIISRENGLTITSPAPDSSFTQPATVYIKAAVKTYDSTVTNVTFYSIDAATGAQTQIGDPDGVEPYEVTWTGMASGNHSLRAVAAYADPTVGPATSEPVAVVIKEPITLPIAPTNLTATAITKNRIDLAWTDNSSNETGFYIDRSTSSNFSKGVTRLMVGGMLNPIRTLD